MARPEELSEEERGQLSARLERLFHERKVAFAESNPRDTYSWQRLAEEISEATCFSVSDQAVRAACKDRKAGAQVAMVVALYLALQYGERPAEWLKGGARSPEQAAAPRQPQRVVYDEKDAIIDRVFDMAKGILRERGLDGERILEAARARLGERKGVVSAYRGRGVPSDRSGDRAR